MMSLSRATRWTLSPVHTPASSPVGTHNRPAREITYGTIDGTAGNPITIQADPNAAPDRSSSILATTKRLLASIWSPACDYITISGITSRWYRQVSPMHQTTVVVSRSAGNNDIVIRVYCSKQLIYGFGIFAD